MVLESGPLLAIGSPLHPLFTLKKNEAWLTRAVAALKVAFLDMSRAIEQPPGTPQEWMALYLSSLGWIEYALAILPRQGHELGVDLSRILPWDQYRRRGLDLLRSLSGLFSRNAREQGHPGLRHSLARLLLEDQETAGTAWVWADAMRWDLLGHIAGHCLGEESPCQVTAGGLTWSYFPTVTARQVEELEMAMGAAPQFLPLSWQGPFSEPPVIHRLDLVDDKVHTSRDEYSVFLDECLLGWKREVQPFLSRLGCEGFSRVLLVSDHGYRENQAFRTERKYEDPRYLHGRATPGEVLSPWIEIRLRF